ncbi:hypothetical protein OJF2_16720 [Aquisphaera giovannonii]|uniref:Uncharacterized protein n=1 Tax=Aquisphaera giovannonii TaxID=406548 RepID=A0A5B9VZH7_9BACT|nr:hypothetical protein OJF2_16720 [Aquisphaera giovannonii]
MGLGRSLALPVLDTRIPVMKRPRAEGPWHRPEGPHIPTDSAGESPALVELDEATPGTSNLGTLASL